jgi:hypothetical protein
VSARGEVAAPRRARPDRPSAAVVAALVLLTLVLLAGAAAACGDSAASGVALYLGDWQRVEGGEPNPAVTLHVEADGDDAALTFEDSTRSFRAQAPATPQDDVLVMEMPAENGIVDGATSLQLSLDAGGQLVVDQVLADGTSEPVWVYERVAE